LKGKECSIFQIPFWEGMCDYFAGGIHNFTLLTKRTHKKGFVFWIRTMLRPKQYYNKNPISG
jgi:hypothetical protein